MNSLFSNSLRLYTRNTPTYLFRNISTSSAAGRWKVAEKTTGKVTVVEMEKMNDGPGARRAEEPCALCTCNVSVKITYKDVLILEQFMRDDGTVLPRQLTGLCKKQQLRVERCVMQAHWSGLFPDKTIPELDRAGYKRFNRYWNDDMDMYRLSKKVEQGTWYYIKRYPTKNRPIFADPMNK